MSDKWSHDQIISLLNLASDLASKTHKNYCLTKGMQVQLETSVIQKQGHNAILETCKPIHKL